MIATKLARATLPLFLLALLFLGTGCEELGGVAPSLGGDPDERDKYESMATSGFSKEAIEKQKRADVFQERALDVSNLKRGDDLEIANITEAIKEAPFPGIRHTKAAMLVLKGASQQEIDRARGEAKGSYTKGLFVGPDLERIELSGHLGALAQMMELLDKDKGSEAYKRGLAEYCSQRAYGLQKFPTEMAYLNDRPTDSPVTRGVCK